MPAGRAATPLQQGAGRYAPSPTGQLHLGNLRTAVLAWLFARSTGWRFLLCIGDLDFSRVRPGLAEQQRADLAALGLDFDESPVIQSQRMGADERSLERLAELSYECFCSRREIAEAASAPHGSVARYPGICRSLTARCWATRCRPTYAHVPLAVNSAGQRLAMRDGPVTLADLGELGVSPVQVLDRIAESLNLAEPGEHVTLEDLLDRFRPERVPSQPWWSIRR
jgi:glutamyl/glutaminyl-tRNA synthetase